jgi:small conductance mechanosensitive channel
MFARRYFLCYKKGMENIDFRAMFESATPWLLDHGVKILIILVVIVVGRSVLSYVIERSVRAIVRQSSNAEAERKRENTLINVFNKTAGIVLWLMAGLMILSEIGVEIGPILAAAGVVGLAVGFGGQYLIKDLFAGLFILFENQYRVGDVVELAGVTGTVENFNLRVTVLRDIEGQVHYVPNGQISVASNKTQEFAKINMIIGVGYGDDIDKVERVVNGVGGALANDERWKDSIREAPRFSRIDSFGDSSVNIKIVGEVDAGKQWELAGDLRRDLKKAFDSEGIEIPFPQRVIHSAKTDG